MRRASLTSGAAVLYIKGMYQPFQFFMPAQIFFGAGSLDNLGSAPLPGTKALIVIGGSSVKRLGYLDCVQALLKKQGVESVVFDKVQPNPVVEHVMEASSLARETGCDFVIGLGGGSSMDSAKSIAVMAANPGITSREVPARGFPFPANLFPSSASPLRREPERRRIRGPSSRKRTRRRRSVSVSGVLSPPCLS